MTSITAYFINGPLTGQYYALQQPWQEYIVETNVGVDFNADPDALIKTKKVTYERLATGFEPETGEVVYYCLKPEPRT